jgi:fructose-bisphosphate aldolase class II
MKRDRAIARNQVQHIVRMRQPTVRVAARMFKNYDCVLKLDGELGNKKVYDPRWYLALAETAMAERVKQPASDLRASGRTMFAS